MDEGSTEFLQNMSRALTAEDPGEAQDQLAEFTNENADDSAVTASVMDLIDKIDNVRRKNAFDAVVAIVLHTPPESEMHGAGLAKWNELIEREAEKNLFRALDLSALPCLYSDEFSSLHAAGLKKWRELLDRAALADFDGALQHAKNMEGSDPSRPFAKTAKFAASLLQSWRPKPDWQNRPFN